MEMYTTRINQLEIELKEVSKRHSMISYIRLACGISILYSGYCFLENRHSFYLILAFVFLVTFFVLMKKHEVVGTKKRLKEALIAINKEELEYVTQKKMPFANGSEFNDFSHPYCFDLDIFGNQSLFQNVNRTNTYIGKTILAKQLLKVLPNAEIIENQEAIKELNDKLNWRHDFASLARVGKDSKLVYDTLMKWVNSKSIEFSLKDTIISFATPIVITVAFLVYLTTANPSMLTVISYLFALNLGILGGYFKRIKIEISNTVALNKTINQYSLLIQSIENEIFESKKLKDLQYQLHSKHGNVSSELKKLSELFSRMDSVNNFAAALVFNGSFLFHIHTLKALINWKKSHASSLKHWLDIIGEMEMLLSLSNFSYNNPTFTFPEINSDYEISFTNLAHPLLNAKSRIGNDVTFKPQSFMILTGSNMSGKSTFLRSLGINMVLTSVGAPVCANAAKVHPMPVLVSMRLSDSLSDSESYFFAEIKRLKLIMDLLGNSRAFVLLDEILRGTNSDDKQNGTIEVIKKMITKEAIGAIATHDIEVCLTTNDYPNQLTNKCFEVEIVSNELHFDYKLRDGICKNKSATFLMKKMGVI